MKYSKLFKGPVTEIIEKISIDAKEKYGKELLNRYNGPRKIANFIDIDFENKDQEVLSL